MVRRTSAIALNECYSRHDFSRNVFRVLALIRHYY
jgi:hypothetical protein